MKKSVYSFNFKRFSGLGLLALAMALPSSMLGQDVTSNLMVHYTFDNVTGTTVPDATGNNWTAQLQGAAAVDAGYLGSSVSCPAQADYILMPNDVFQTMGTEFTFSAWVKVNALGNWSRVFDFGQNDVTNYSFFATNQGGGMPKFTICRNGGDQGYLDVVASTAFPVGSWVHVAVTVAGGTAGKMYFNGTLVGSGTYNKNNSTLETISLSELGSLAGLTNYIGKSHWNDAALNGKIDDVRIYKRALSVDDVAKLASEQPQSELFTQWKNLSLGNISGLTSNITLPTTLGTNGVVVSWSSSSKFITNQGEVTRHAIYDMPVDLLATVSQPGVTTETLTKTFNAVVLGVNVAEPGLIAEWDFSNGSISLDGDVVKVKDVSGSNFEGTLKDVARIRTIGETEKFNVLDLGNSKGYFDMGTAIGEAVYSLNDFAVGGYYRMDADYADNNAWGNNLFSFSNSEEVLTNPNGTMYVCLGNTNYGISPGAWNAGGENGLNPSNHPAKGTWHHVMYTQVGKTGTIYVDGAKVSSGEVGYRPYNTLYKEGLSGTNFNWIGRPPYQPSGDVYLRKTLVYDLQVYNLAVSADDVTNLDFPLTINALNAAYAENPDNISNDLQVEIDNLKKLDWNAVSANLPTQGTTNTSVKISWISNRTNVINAAGEVTRPDFLANTVQLTASLSLGAQFASQTFEAKVLPKVGTEYTSDLVAKFDFENVSGNTVTDAAEKHFVGTVTNDATVASIGDGTTGVFKVLSLGSTNGYLDMGTDIGKAIYGLNDYTVGGYFRVDNSNTDLGNNGNFLWTFANSEDILTTPTGYMFGGLKNTNAVITPIRWGEEQGLSSGLQSPKGGWHHLAYTQNGTTGTLYFDGVAQLTGTVSNIPATALAKDLKVGTLYNWLGRPCYAPDTYLHNTLVTDFRIYNRALTQNEIFTSVVGVSGKLLALEAAYKASPATKVNPIFNSNIKVIGGKGMLSIVGLTGTENVLVVDLLGRPYKATSASSMALPAGVYVVKVDRVITKVIVK